MESAVFGLVGVLLGGFLTIGREWWFLRRKNRKDAEYLSVQVSCALERYVSQCAEVVSDDGLCDGQPDEHGYRRIQIPSPTFSPESLNVEWKSLPASLLYEVLDFPHRADRASRVISNVFEYAALPPDFDEGFEERQFQFANLGISASQLAVKLREHVGLLKKSEDADWNPLSYMQEQMLAIERRRMQRDGSGVEVAL
jgi:hypothetical protein